MLERAWLLEQVCGIGDDGQLDLAPHPGLRPLVELQHLRVAAAYDQQRRRAYLCQSRRCQVRPAGPADDRRDPRVARGRPERRRGAGAGPEVPGAFWFVVLLPIGYFGASTGAAAALWAAAGDPRVAAIVSRGGRPDLAAPRLAEVRAATLLIVGGRDAEVLQLNQWAQARMRCQVELAIVPNATHLFEEPGTLEHAAGLARDWFVDQLGREAADRATPVRQPTS